MSKIVFLKRAIPFVHEAIKSEAMQEQLALTHRSIGNWYVSSTNRKLGTGLTTAEENLLIPLLLGVDISNQGEYNKLKEQHFTDIVTKIPAGKGLELNIGLLDDSKPLGYKFENGTINLPENVENYCRFRHAVGFPYTAASVEEANGNKTAWYYIEDPSKVTKSKLSKLDIDDRAQTAYLKIKSNPKDVDMFLSVMRTYIKKEAGKPPVNIKNIGEAEKVLYLKGIVASRPEKFLEFAEDADIKKKYLVEEAYGFKILGRIGNTFVDVEDGNYALGDTAKEVVMKLWNDKETARLNRIKAAVTAAMETSNILA